MILPGCYNENLIDAIDINDPLDIALMTDDGNEILEDELSEQELDDMMNAVEAGLDLDDNDEMFETSTDPLDIEIDEDIEDECDADSDGELIDIVDGEIGY